MRRGIFLGWAAALVLTSSVALGASATPGAITGGTVLPSDVDAQYQRDFADSVETYTGLKADTVYKITVDNTNGTALVSIAGTAQYASPGDGTVLGNTLDTLNTIMSGGSGPRTEADLRLAMGEPIVGLTMDSAFANMNAIRQSVDSKILAVQNEQRIALNKFGSDTGLAAAYMNCNPANRIWAGGFHTRQDMSAKDGYDGYKYKATGAMLGYDHAFGPLVAGIAVSYSRGDYSQKMQVDDNTIDNYGGSAYATYYSPAGFFGTVYGGYNYGKNDMKNWMQATSSWVTGKNHTNSYWAGGKVGYDISQVCSNWIFTPSVGLVYQRAEGSAFTTQNNGLFAQNFAKVKSNALLLPIEVAAQYRVDMSETSSIGFRVAGGYTYNFRNKGARGSFNWGDQPNPATPVTIQGQKPGRSGWNASAGINYRVNQFDVSVDYRYDGKKKYDGHRVTGTIGISF